MPRNHRLEEIRSYLRQHRYADLSSLSEKFCISQSTARRALNDLETQGLIRRHHGGASWVGEESEAPSAYSFISQDKRQRREKEYIATRIASLIEDGMTIFLDGGTSTFAVARKIVSKRLQIITNSLPIADLMGKVSSCETLVTGGTIYSRLGILYGPICELSISKMHADMAILGGAGLTPEGLWNANPFIVETQRRMAAAADKVILALDHTKMGKKALSHSLDFSPNMTLITDRSPPQAILSSLHRSGAGCVVIEKEES